FRAHFGDVGRDLVYSVHVYRGDSHYPIVSAFHTCTPPRLLPTRRAAPPPLPRRVPLPLVLCPPTPTASVWHRNSAAAAWTDFPVLRHFQECLLYGSTSTLTMRDVSPGRPNHRRSILNWSYYKGASQGAEPYELVPYIVLSVSSRN